MNRIIYQSIKGMKTFRKQIQQMSIDSNIYNLSPKIIELVDRNLLKVPNHPLTTIKSLINNKLGQNFECFDELSPIVSIKNNFDVLGIEPQHVSRNPSDTFYINHQYVLRTHTSAHQVEKLTQNLSNFVVFGDVYRRDQIDKYHYPAFHQMEAVRMMGNKHQISIEEVATNLKSTVEQIIQQLFGQCEKRWVEAYFPFTNPSFELQILQDGKWIEMLGCGVIHENVLKVSGRLNERGWAAGLGLERLAMKLFRIPDVRLFWSKDDRFINQFKQNQISQFESFSKYPGCLKDFSMWVSTQFNPNDLYGIIREVAGDLVETVQEIDHYFNPQTNQHSKTYRICFRSLNQTLTNNQIVKLQFQIRDQIDHKLKHVKLR